MTPPQEREYMRDYIEPPLDPPEPELLCEARIDTGTEQVICNGEWQWMVEGVLRASAKQALYNVCNEHLLPACRQFTYCTVIANGDWYNETPAPKLVVEQHLESDD